MDSFPDNFQIHFKVTMREGIAHFIGKSPRNFRVLFRKVGVVFCDVVACLTNDLKIADYCVLGFFVAEKGGFGEIFHITVNALYLLRECDSNILAHGMNRLYSYRDCFSEHLVTKAIW